MRDGRRRALHRPGADAARGPRRARHPGGRRHAGVAPPRAVHDARPAHDAVARPDRRTARRLPRRCVVPAAGRWAGCSDRPRACTTASASSWPSRGRRRCGSATGGPNDLDACCLDLAAAVQLAVGSGRRARRRDGPQLRRCGRGAGRRSALPPSSSAASSPSPRSRPAARWPAGSAAGRCCSSTASVTRSSRSTGQRGRAGHRRATASWWSSPATATCLAQSGTVLWERLLEWLPALCSVRERRRERRAAGGAPSAAS